MMNLLKWRIVCVCVGNSMEGMGCFKFWKYRETISFYEFMLIITIAKFCLPYIKI